MNANSIGLWFAGAMCGWAARGLWIYLRHLRRAIRLADDALREQNIENATRHLDHAKTILGVL